MLDARMVFKIFKISTVTCQRIYSLATVAAVFLLLLLLLLSLLESLLVTQNSPSRPSCLNTPPQRIWQVKEHLYR